MFDDSQTNQSQPTEPAANATPTLGLGGGTPTWSGPTNAPAPTTEDTPVAPQVVLPSSLASAAHTEDDTSNDAPAPPTSAPSVNGDLHDIKREALAHLSPLVGKLDQSPEEKYKTLMMMIQASDNQDLISEAYKAAQEITDEKVKAEALLNIVNEINYFTQQKPAN